MLLISYICAIKNENKKIRKIIHTDEFDEYYNLLDKRTAAKYDESILFAIDHDNIIQATNVILLNSFLKKDSKEYRKQIKKAINILNNLEYGTKF